MISVSLYCNKSDASKEAKILMKQLENCICCTVHDLDYLSLINYRFPALHINSPIPLDDLSGLESIKKFVNKILIRDYLLNWLMLEARVSPYLVSIINDQFYCYNDPEGECGNSLGGFGGFWTL